MGKVRVSAFSVSLDGFAAGPGQDLQHPFGLGADEVPAWLRKTKMFHEMIGQPGGTTGIDDDVARGSMENLGAWIMGRNMFGPIRGPWPDENWKGWWGDNPPYHCPVFVLTHHERAPVTMGGGTIFHFVTDGIEAALERALQAANGKDVRVGGGVATIRQYLRTGLIDEMHFAISPVLLGSGEHLFADINTAALGYRCTEHLPTQNATHVVLTK
jgi:dihydrofolate reductase